MLEWIVSGSFLILVVLVLRAALGQKISARFRYALWALVLLRLLVPVQLFTSPVAGMTVQVSEQVREKMAEKSIYAIPIDRIPVEEAEGYVIGEDGQVGDANSFGYAKLENNGEIIVRYADKLSIKQAVELHSPVEMADSFISNYYGIDPEKLEEYIFVMSEEATSAETIVIMKVKDEGDVEKISEALQVVVDEKRGEMENYLPEQFEIVDKSSVKSKGSYVYLVISESGDTIVQMIEEEL